MKTKPVSLYLDYAAATPVDIQVLSAMEPYWSRQFYNPSGLTRASVAVHAAVEAARADIARSIGAKAHQIIFTSGATEANNLALKGVLTAHPDRQLLISAIEHESVFGPGRELAATVLPVNANGIIQLEELDKAIHDNVVLVSIIHTNNEVGAVQPLAKVAKILSDIKNKRHRSGNKLPLLLHSDAVQSPLTLDVQVSRLGVDLMTLSAGKIYGPKGVGCLYVRDRSRLTPQISGGGQELGLRSGTENAPLIIGLAESLKLAAKHRSARVDHFRKLHQQLTAELSARLPDVKPNVSSHQQVDHIINLRVPGIDGEALVMALDGRYGIQTATGSACATSDDAPSHVLLALGLKPAEANQSLRISLGADTTTEDISRFVDALAAVRANLR